MKTVTYAHKDNPNGTRFRALKPTPLPTWVVNVHEEAKDESAPKSPTDQLIEAVLNLLDGTPIDDLNRDDDGLDGYFPRDFDSRIKAIRKAIEQIAHTEKA